jgi:acyl-CoA synthetase (AMP-forming)/AMP-acid ligase II
MTAIDDAHVSLPEIWATHARFSPDKIAAICGEERLSWAEFDAGTARIANLLIAEGVSRGEPVALVMTNSLDMLQVMFGIVRAGACMVPVSALLTPPQIAAMIADSGATLLFASPGTRELIEAAAPPAGVRRVAIGFTGEGWIDGDALRADASPADPCIRPAPGDPFNIIYSSGTTGLPKGIVQAHRARSHFAWAIALELGMTSDTVALATTALYSNGTQFMVLPPLLAGGTIVILESFTPAACLAAIERHRVTHSFLVPTQCIVTLEDPACGRHDLSSLRSLLSAGSPLRADTRAAVIERLTPNLYELYGFSEGFATMLKPGDRPARAGSVGKPVIGFDLRVVGSDDREWPPGEIGEIAGYGTGMMTGYHNRPDLDEAIVWHAPDGRTFLRSGDLGLVDREGFLHIVDRKKDMIISGGFNIYPTDLEAVVAQHPAVQDVTVFGIPHPKWGETPVALVIARAPVDGAELLAFANARLARNQRLAAVELRTAFPRNALGKVLKRELREAWAASHP